MRASLEKNPRSSESPLDTACVSCKIRKPKEGRNPMKIRHPSHRRTIPYPGLVQPAESAHRQTLNTHTPKSASPAHGHPPLEPCSTPKPVRIHCLHLHQPQATKSNPPSTCDHQPAMSPARRSTARMTRKRRHLSTQKNSPHRH